MGEEPSCVLATLGESSAPLAVLLLGEHTIVCPSCLPLPQKWIALAPVLALKKTVFSKKARTVEGYRSNPKAPKSVDN